MLAPPPHAGRLTRTKPLVTQSDDELKEPGYDFRYIHLDCDSDAVEKGHCDLTGVHGWRGEPCQDPKAKAQQKHRCWQSTFAKAKAICERFGCSLAGTPCALSLVCFPAASASG